MYAFSLKGHPKKIFLTFENLLKKKTKKHSLPSASLLTHDDLPLNNLPTTQALIGKGGNSGGGGGV